MTRALSPLSAVLLALSAAACSASGPRDLVAGEDACRYCRMTIDDVRFGTMVITATGRVETFDAIECLASFVAAMPADAPPRSIWVANHDAPSRWIPAANARFLHHSRLRSPMGRELAAFDAAESVPALRARYGGDVISWPDVLALVQREGFAPTGAAGIGPDTTHAHAAAPHRY